MFLPYTQVQLHEGSQASGAEWAGRSPETRPVKREHGCSLPLGYRSPSFPALGIPFPILTPCLMPCPRPDPVLTSLTHTRAHTVCLITMSVSGHWDAMGSHPGSQQVSAFPGEWEGRAGESDVEAPTSVPLPSRSCTPPSLPPRNASSQDSWSQGLGSSQRQDMGLHPGAGLCNSHLQWRCRCSGSRTRPELGSGEEQPGPVTISPTCAETSEGTAAWGQCSGCCHPERGWWGWFSVGWLWRSTLRPPGELWIWFLSRLPSPGSWHCPRPWSACQAGCCSHRQGPVFNCFSFQTSGTAGPSR